MTSSTVKPAEFDLTIPRSGTVRQRFRFPFDGTGMSVDAYIYSNESRTRILATLSVTYLARAPKFDFVLGAEVSFTSTVRKDATWDLFINNPDGTRDFWITGNAVLAQ
jgi:hypothetical protein